MKPTGEDEFNLVSPIINKKELRIISLIRIKANLLPRRDRIIKHGFHVDMEFPCTTAIYYANTCDGYTEFEDGTIVESVQNRFVTFPSSMKHTGTTCTDNKSQNLLNEAHRGVPQLVFLLVNIVLRPPGRRTLLAQTAWETVLLLMSIDIRYHCHCCRFPTDGGVKGKNTAEENKYLELIVFHNKAYST